MISAASSTTSQQPEECRLFSAISANKELMHVRRRTHVSIYILLINFMNEQLLSQW